MLINFITYTEERRKFMKKASQTSELTVLPFIFIFAFVFIFNSLSISGSAYVITNINEEDIFLVNVIIDPDFNTDEIEKYVALTFDDGPHPVYTKKILDVLEEKNVSATFFVVGFRAELHPNILLRMKELNCEIGNHTYEHKDLKKISKADALYQINNCSDIISDITGEYPKIYRPPFGKIGSELEKEIDMTKVLWTIDSWDWKYKNEKLRIVNNVVNKTKKNSIILMHDFYKTTLAALPDIIDRLQADGFEFITVSELLEFGCFDETEIDENEDIQYVYNKIYNYNK